MNTNKKTPRILEDVKINVKMKLSALWVAVMFLYVYADIKAFYKPGFIEEVMSGEAAGMQITQVWLLGGAIFGMHGSGLNRKHESIPSFFKPLRGKVVITLEHKNKT